MQRVEFYLDESEAGAGRWLVVAGWIFSEVSSRTLHEEWSALLCKHRLPFFRQTDCAHGNAPFDRFSDGTERGFIQRRFYEALIRNALGGFCVTYDLRFAHLCPHAVDDSGIRLFHVTPYTLCCYWAFLLAKNWADRRGYEGEISYFFEVGHSSQRQATRMMDQVFSNPRLCEIFRHGGHGFVKKKESAAVQCSDVLAWHWGKSTKDRAAGKRKPRADLLALVSAIDVQTVHFDEPMIRSMLQELARHAPPRVVGVDALSAYWTLPNGLSAYWAGRAPYRWLLH